MLSETGDSHAHGASTADPTREKESEREIERESESERAREAFTAGYWKCSGSALLVVNTNPSFSLAWRVLQGRVLM